MDTLEISTNHVSISPCQLVPRRVGTIDSDNPTHYQPTTDSLESRFVDFKVPEHCQKIDF